MRFVDNDGITDPRLNLALEEYLLRQVELDEPLLLFYVNEPAVIIGRNQNTLEEIDPDYVEAQGIHIVRRLSGGGTVYHDLGNLNFSFITNGKETLHNFHLFTEPVIKVLLQLGVEAELRGKSDIFANGKKISGNAQYATTRRMFSHGTLLFDTDLGEMLRAINPRRTHIESKAVQSVRNFVTNILELLPRPMTLDEFRTALLSGIFNGGPILTHPLTAADWQAVRELADNRYMTWEWNIGRSPAFDVRKSERLPAGKVDAHIDVNQGHIREVKFYGDFSGSRNIAELERLFVGVRYDRQGLTAALQAVDLSEYFGVMETAEFVELLY